MLTREQFEKIIKLAHDIEIDSYQLAVEHCEGYSYDGIEAASTEASKNGMQQKVDMSFWDDFLERVYLENHRSYYK
ncbi:hypothetical protein T4583L_100 [Escherichia phage T4]|nr:hypothetical protein T4583L_100 [Escherichia phage T4]